MQIILSKTNNPAFNIATEEYLLNTFCNNIFYLYINTPSIIVGRKQNTLAEINYEYIKENNIPVVRRMSGGGAVFHDLGNLNFCFIVRQADNPNADFSRYTQPIIDVLRNMGIDARIEGRNDLTIEGKKFSGNAKYVRNKTLLQHGTILYDSNLSNVALALKIDPQKYVDKAVKSVQSRITNIATHLKEKVSLEDFTQMIISHVISLYSEAVPYELTDFDIASIDTLVEEKYGTWDWNYGKSPVYNYSKSLRTAGGTLQVSMDVKNGVIKKIVFYGDYFSIKDIDEYENIFINCPHDQIAIEKLLVTNPPENYFINIDKNDLLKILF